jgi:hypothetical protein
MGAMLPPVPSRLRAGQQAIVQSGQPVQALVPSQRNALVIGSETGNLLLGADTVRDVLTVPSIRRASYLNPDSALVLRGNRIERQRETTRAFDGVVKADFSILQGSALKSTAARTHNLVSSVARIGSRTFATYCGTNGTLYAAGDNQPGTFVVLAVSDDDGVTWAEKVQIVANVATDIVYDCYPMVWNNRLFLNFSHGGNQRCEGFYTMEVTNPLATMNFLLSGPYLCQYGRAQFPFVMNGAPWIGNDYSVHVADIVAEAGQHVCRFHPDGADGPMLERCGLVTNVTSAIRVASEASYVPLSGGRLLMTRRTTSGAYYAISPDGGVTWPAPAAWAFTAAGPDTRSCCWRTTAGRIAFAVNNAAARTNLTIYLSEDFDSATAAAGTPTFPYSKELVAARSEYPFGISVGSKLYVSYDSERGYRNSTSSNHAEYLAIVDEEEIVAGTATVTTRTITS